MSEHIPNLNIFNGTVRRRAANAPVLWALLLLILPVVSVSTASASEAVQRLVILGDSLTAGYGLTEKEAFPARLEAHLKALGHAVEVEGAGVSGDTTAGGLARLDWSIGADADAVIVELGGNDALRGLSPALTEENLRQIVERLRARGLPARHSRRPTNPATRTSSPRRLPPWPKATASGSATAARWSVSRSNRAGWQA